MAPKSVNILTHKTTNFRNSIFKILISSLCKSSFKTVNELFISYTFLETYM